MENASSHDNHDVSVIFSHTARNVNYNGYNYMMALTLLWHPKTNVAVVGLSLRKRKLIKMLSSIDCDYMVVTQRR